MAAQRKYPEELRERAVKMQQIGLDQYVPMFAPCLLGCPDIVRHNPVSAARRGCGQPDRMAVHGTY
jgi:hypothetical protein